MPVLIALFVLMFYSLPARALSVVGVIASDHGGVALVRPKVGAAPVVVRAGERVAENIFVNKIARDFVDFKIHGRIERARVGEDLVSDPTQTTANVSGIERHGNKVVISAQLREQIVRRDLGKVLMQAAAVPYYMNGELRGFSLWDIDQGSVYELAGFKNGDIVVAINGSDIVDVGSAIRTLHSLRDESEASVRVLRNGSEETILIAVQ